VALGDDLLIAAATSTPSDLLDFAKSLAGAAISYGTFNDGESYAQLNAAARAFTMMIKLHNAHK
jgi:hypothetical protein